MLGEPQSPKPLRGMLLNWTNRCRPVKTAGEAVLFGLTLHRMECASWRWGSMAGCMCTPLRRLLFRRSWGSPRSWQPRDQASCWASARESVSGRFCSGSGPRSRAVEAAGGRRHAAGTSRQPVHSGMRGVPANPRRCKQIECSLNKPVPARGVRVIHGCRAFFVHEGPA